MRIVGGVFKGRKLAEFKGEEIRPTSDMARESLFNIFQHKIYGADFLDLFCGTGAVGIEALSRGAEKVVFNDISRESLKVLKSNLDKIANPSNVEIFNKDALKMLDGGEKFDIIFIDAPYKSQIIEEVLGKCSVSLKDDGCVVIENEKPFDGDFEKLIKYDQRKYGRAVFSFFKKV